MGRKSTLEPSKEALEHGVAMVHQELNQALKRNVMDNIWLGRYPRWGAFTSEKMLADTAAIFDDLGIHVDSRTIMSTMPVAQRQMGGDCQSCLRYHSDVIVFDERHPPRLLRRKWRHLFRIINMLRDRGCGIIYISHKMEGDPAYLRRSDRHARWRVGRHRAGSGTDDGAHHQADGWAVS